MRIGVPVVLSICWALLSIAGDSNGYAALKKNITDTPFLWGVANASFQVEGSPADSDWLRFTHKKGAIADGTTADVATDFWNRYDLDFKLAQDLGARAFRLSLAWERIEPKEGTWDLAALDHYKQMIRALRARGLEPVVTIYHWTNPAWVAERGGLTWDGFPKAFARYAEFVVKELAAESLDVRWWITLNEPEVQALAGYFEGVFPPARPHDLNGFKRALENLALAHIQAMTQIRAAELPGYFSIAKNWKAFAPKEKHNPLYTSLTQAGIEFYNKQFLRAIRTGRVQFGIPGVNPSYKIVPIPKGGTLDFVGINYYSRSVITFGSKPPFYNVEGGNLPKSEMGWEIYPRGLYEAVSDAYEQNKLPILVTENGISDGADALRPDFLASHLSELLRAKRNGVPVLGYLHWSLTDNFEWAQGLSRRFGLVEIDYKTLERYPRASYFYYKEIIRNSGL